MLRIVAEYADTWNAFGSVEEMRERNALLDAQCAAIGRDPKEISRSLYGWASMMGSDSWQSADAFTQIIGAYRDAPGEDRFPLLERIAADIIPAMRAE